MMDTLERASRVDPSGYRHVTSGGSQGVSLPSPQPIVPTGPGHFIVASFPASIVGAAVAQQQTRMANVPRMGVPAL